MSRYEDFVEENPTLRGASFEFNHFFKGAFTYIHQTDEHRYVLRVTPEYRMELLPRETLRDLYDVDEDVVDTLEKWGR